MQQFYPLTSNCISRTLSKEAQKIMEEDVHAIPFITGKTWKPLKCSKLKQCLNTCDTLLTEDIVQQLGLYFAEF